MSHLRTKQSPWKLLHSVTIADTALTAATKEDLAADAVPLGSDDNAFTNAANQCFARVDTITATDLSLGKTTKQMVVEAVAAPVDIMLPTFIRNEPDPANIKVIAGIIIPGLLIIFITFELLMVLPSSSLVLALLILKIKGNAKNPITEINMKK